MNNEGLCLIAVIFGLLFTKCSSNQSNMMGDNLCSLVGTYYQTYEFEGTYEYAELQFTHQGYLLGYLNMEGIAPVSVYKLDSDSTFLRWWKYGESEYRFYLRNDTLYLQLVDITSQGIYKPYIKIEPEITLQNSFENEDFREKYYEEAWTRFLFYTQGE